MSKEELKSKITDILVMINNISIDTSFDWETKPSNSEWSYKQIIHHTADALLNHFYRSKLLLTTENPFFIDIDLEKWIVLGDNNSNPIAAKNIIHGLFQKWLILLDSIDDQDMLRKGTHEKFGDVTLELIFNLGLNHTNSHLKAILGLFV